MWLHDENPEIKPIYDMLRRLGITSNYRGFYYAAYAVWLAVRNPEALLLVTKWLYPDVATQYHTTWSAVERGIRTVVSIAWANNPDLLCELAGCSLPGKPQPGRFLAILSSSFILALQQFQTCNEHLSC